MIHHKYDYIKQVFNVTKANHPNPRRLLSQCLINPFLILLQYALSVDLLCARSQTLINASDQLWTKFFQMRRGRLKMKTEGTTEVLPKLTFCGVHSSSAMTNPSIISIPFNPPPWPVFCISLSTASFSFLSCTNSSRPWPLMPSREAKDLSAGSAGTMMAMGLLFSAVA